jgi:hypothetical protein
MLDSYKIHFNYIEISSVISHSSLIALLAIKITQYDSLTTIDLTNCPKVFIPLVLQTAYYLPAYIKEIYINGDELGATTISYPIVALDFDPDHETLLLKEMLSFFLSKQDYYSDFAFNGTLSSNILLQIINDEQVKSGLKEYKYPYIQACLSVLSQEQKGKFVYLQKRHNSSDKRALVYTITDQGVLTLLIWYLAKNKSEKNNLFQKLHLLFNEITFSEILYQYTSNANFCSICGNQELEDLFTCTLCGQESCKNCLDNHFLENSHTQLQIS